jgi:hypothetical protein
VGIAIWRVGAPDEDVVPLLYGTTLDGDERLLVAAVGVDEHHARKRSAGGAHELDQELGQHRVADEERAGKSRVLAAGPVRHRRRHGHSPTAARQPRSQGSGDPGIGVERKVRAMLLE